MKCPKCNSKMMSLGMEKVDFGKDYMGKVRTCVCLKDDSFMFMPVPKQDYLFWNETRVKGRGKNARTVVGVLERVNKMKD